MAPRRLSGGRDQIPATTASSSMRPSPMKKPGPTTRFTHGKQLQSAPRSAL